MSTTNGERPVIEVWYDYTNITNENRSATAHAELGELDIHVSKYGERAHYLLEHLLRDLRKAGYDGDRDAYRIIFVQEDGTRDEIRRVEAKCSACAGSGVYSRHGVQCHDCDGHGSYYIEYLVTTGPVLRTDVQQVLIQSDDGQFSAMHYNEFVAQHHGGGPTRTNHRALY